MAACKIPDCKGAVVGGFQEETTHDFGPRGPHTTQFRVRTLWCEDHKQFLNRDLGEGRLLTVEEAQNG